MDYCRFLLPVCLAFAVICQCEVGGAQVPVQDVVRGREEAPATQEEQDSAKDRVESAELSAGSPLGALWHGVVSVWNYEITAVEDRSITVGTVVSSVFLLFVGIVLSRLLSQAFGQRVLPRLGMHRSAAAAIQSLTFYALTATFTLWALRFVNIPLTMFTFLGGAIAIGVGFGSQNIVNNFISGLIL